VRAHPSSHRRYARSQAAGHTFHIAKPVEHEQRVIAHTSEMAVVRGACSSAVSFTDAAIHVEYHSGSEAWQANGLPETELDVQEW
jgi:hypothetical protein